MLEFVEFELGGAIASLNEGKPVISRCLDVIYQQLTIKLAD
ncbi:hypothetical protein [Calothrix sp. NIES-2100]